MSQPPKFWEKPARYDGVDYDLSHLKPLTRQLKRGTGIDIPLIFNFSYHCCTDKADLRRGLGTRIIDEPRPTEERFLCPVRWFLSQRLRNHVQADDRVRLARTAGYQWLNKEPIPGLSSQWVIFFKVMPGPPGGSVMVSVESAYLASVAPQGGQPEVFKFIVEQTRRTNKLYGSA